MSEKETNDTISPLEDKIDPDFEQKPEKSNTADGSILSEQYDNLPPLEITQNENELEGKEGIRLEYGFKGDDVREGLALFQKVTIRKRNLIYTAILALMFIFYAINMLNNSADRFSMFIAVVSVAMIGVIWVMPWLHIKKTAQAADDNDMRFILTVYDECVSIGEDKGVCILHYKKEIDKIFESANLFLVCAGKERLFLIPKRCFENEIQQSQIRDIFINAMSDDFYDKT